jgi:hypothetical protein
MGCSPDSGTKPSRTCATRTSPPLAKARGRAGLARPAGAVLASGETESIMPEQADLIVTKARIFTMDQANPRAEAIAIRDGTIVAVADAASIAGSAGTLHEDPDRSPEVIMLWELGGRAAGLSLGAVGLGLATAFWPHAAANTFSPPIQTDRTARSPDRWMKSAAVPLPSRPWLRSTPIASAG